MRLAQRANAERERPGVTVVTQNIDGLHSLSARAINMAMAALAGCDLMVSIGTSAVVYPAAELPLIAKRAGAHLVEINPEDTPISHAYDTCLRGTATAMLEQLFAAS